MNAAEKARLKAEVRRRRATQTDEMGFPKQPQGGSSTDTNAVNEFRPKMNAAFDGLVQGATFGLNDEYVGARDALFGGDGDTLSDRYSIGRDAQRATNQASQQQEPVAFGGGQIAGAMGPAMLAGPLATGRTALGTAFRGSLLGAAEGGVHGAGNSNGVDTLKSTGQGALIGAGVGAAAPLALGGLSAGKRMISDPATGVVDTLLNRGNSTKSNRALAKLMQSSKKTPAQVSEEMALAASQGQPEFRLMDALGVQGQRAASGISRSGGESGAEIAEYLSTRQAGQSDRVGSFVDDAFGMSGGTAKQVTSDLTDARSSAANTAYDAARGNAGPVDVRGALGVIDQRIGGMQGSNVVGDGIDAKLSGYRNRLAAEPAPNGEISRELSDFDRVLGVKQAVQDDIGAAVRAGRNNEARELGKIVSELDTALEASSTPYRAANDGFREASGVIDAIDQGAGMSRPNVRSDDALAQFNAMTPDQQGAARIGYGDQLLAKIEGNTSPTANKAKMLQSPKRDAEAQGIALGADQYSSRLARENAMWQTQNRATGGSMTADNIEDVSGAGRASSGIGGALKSAANFQLGDAAANALSALGPIARGQNDATRMLIAKALMSKDPQKALAPMLRQQATSDGRSRVLEALIRNAGRDPASQAIAR